MSRLGNHSTNYVDIPTLSRIIRDWGLDDPEGKQEAINRLHNEQERQGVPKTPYAHLYVPAQQAQNAQS